MESENRSSYGIVGIVAVVAIVGLITLLKNPVAVQQPSQQPAVVVVPSGASGNAQNLAGQAMDFNGTQIKYCWNKCRNETFINSTNISVRGCMNLCTN